MVKQKEIEEDSDFDEDFNEEEIDEDSEDPFDEEEKKPQPPPIRPVNRRMSEKEKQFYDRNEKKEQPVEIVRTNKFAPQPKPVAEDRYVGVHSPAIDGLMDKKANKLVTNDLWEALGVILSKLERIEESLG